MLYISSGKYKGRKVLVPKGAVRPPMSLMREAMFSVLFNLDSLNFLDLFSGSGIMSLEALSRGALKATMVDFNKAALEIINKNFSFVEEEYKFYLRDVMSFIKSDSLSYDLIYIDPPFNYKNKEELLLNISQKKSLKENLTLIIHYPKQENLPNNIANFEKFKAKIYGGSRLEFFRIKS